MQIDLTQCAKVLNKLSDAHSEMLRMIDMIPINERQYLEWEADNLEDIFTNLKRFADLQKIQQGQ